MALSMYYMVSNIFCYLIILILVANYRFNDRQSYADDFTVMAIWVSNIYLVSSIARLCTRGLWPLDNIVEWSYFTNSLTFIVGTLASYYWNRYFTTVMGNTSFDSLWIFMCMMSIEAFLLFLNYQTQWFFRIDNNGFLINENFFLLLVIAPAAYLFYGMFFMIKNIYIYRTYLYRTNFRGYLYYPIPVLLGLLLSIFDNIYAVLAPSVTIGVVAISIDAFNKLISEDTLTKLNNRAHFEREIEDFFTDSTSYESYLYIIDIDDFKNINDTYGHISGDAALMTVANALKLSVPQAVEKLTIARYAGDEFVVAAVFKNQNEAKTFKHKINHNIDQLSQKEAFSFDLNLSIGLARREKGMKYRTLFETADTDLYRVKIAKKVGRQQPREYVPGF